MLTKDDLVNDMAEGCRGPADFRIGIEHEQFLFNRADGSPLPYDGAPDNKPGILQILKAMAARGWDETSLGGYLIALSKAGGQAVSLEPGGQFEFASAPCRTIDEVKAQAGAFYSDLDAVCALLGVGILAAGFPPHWKRDEIHWMPKARYKIMREYMPRVGKHGLDMMLRTAGAQINLDFSSEADMVKKFRVSMAVQPAITALMANSRMAEGRDTGFASYRSHMWTATDPERCGVPAFIFEEGMGFARYVEFALAAPMYFIYRDGEYTDASGLYFEDFMKGTLPGHEGMVATIEDWHQHLTTLFPEVRLKRYLELRGPDSAPAPWIHAMTAFWTGIFYDQQALNEAYSLIEATPPEDHQRLRNDAARLGLGAALHDGRLLREMAASAIKIARAGLLRQPLQASAAGDLDIFLETSSKAA